MTQLAVSEMLVVPSMYVVIFPVLSPFASVRTFGIVMDTLQAVLSGSTSLAFSSWTIVTCSTRGG